MSFLCFYVEFYQSSSLLLLFQVPTKYNCDHRCPLLFENVADFSCLTFNYWKLLLYRVGGNIELLFVIKEHINCCWNY